jgi:hypothetical protein
MCKYENPDILTCKLHRAFNQKAKHPAISKISVTTNKFLKLSKFPYSIYNISKQALILLHN